MTNAASWRSEVEARVNAAIAGSYNEQGAERWWQRQRHAFDGRSPAQLLADADSQTSPEVTRLIAHAEELLSGPREQLEESRHRKTPRSTDSSG